MNIEDRERKFIYELSELSRKYGIVIGGCGCCESPFLIDAEESEWVDIDGRYEKGKELGDSELEWVRRDR